MIFDWGYWTNILAVGCRKSGLLPPPPLHFGLLRLISVIFVNLVCIAFHLSDQFLSNSFAWLLMEKLDLVVSYMLNVAGQFLSINMSTFSREKKKTRPDTRLPKSLAGGQGQ